MQIYAENLLSFSIETRILPHDIKFASKNKKKTNSVFTKNTFFFHKKFVKIKITCTVQIQSQNHFKMICFTNLSLCVEFYEQQFCLLFWLSISKFFFLNFLYICNFTNWIRTVKRTTHLKKN